MATEQKNLLVIEDSTIRSMMNDPRMVELMPQLATAKKQLESIKKGKPNCRRCKAEKKQIVADAMNMAKGAVRSLRGAKLSQAKRLLNTRQLRVVARNGRGKSVKYTL